MSFSLVCLSQPKRDFFLEKKNTCTSPQYEPVLKRIKKQKRYSNAHLI